MEVLRLDLLNGAYSSALPWVSGHGEDALIAACIHMKLDRYTQHVSRGKNHIHPSLTVSVCLSCIYQSSIYLYVSIYLLYSIPISYLNMDISCEYACMYVFVSWEYFKMKLGRLIYKGKEINGIGSLWVSIFEVPTDYEIELGSQLLLNICVGVWRLWLLKK